MGRYVKNVVISSGSFAVQFPPASTSIGPQFPQNGQLKYNADIALNANGTSTGRPIGLQMYKNGSWIATSMVGSVPIAKDTFVGDGFTTSFVMSHSYVAGQEPSIFVFVGNIYQNPNTAYTVNGYNISFTSTPDVNLTILILHNFNSTQVS